MVTVELTDPRPPGSAGVYPFHDVLELFHNFHLNPRLLIFYLPKYLQISPRFGDF